MPPIPAVFPLALAAATLLLAGAPAAAQQAAQPTAPAAQQAPQPTAPTAQQPSRPAAPATQQAAQPTAPGDAADPVLARVDGQPVRASDVLEAASDLLPPEIRAAPPAAVFAMLPPDMVRQLIDRAITERAFLNAARKAGLDKDPEVQRRIRRAEEQELVQSLLGREVNALVTDAAVRARYDRDTAGRQGEEEVQARHILVRTETEARQALAEAQRPNADFAEIARRRSIDPGAQSGGDLGFFKKADMVPEFANAAFALQPGQISPAPVRSPFGWHIIKVEARRTAPAAAFEEVQEQLRRQMMEEQVEAVVRRVRDAAQVERLDQPAPARSLMDNAAPPPGPAPAAPPARR